MLKTKVILSDVTNLSDARYASGMGVDYIGFNINTDSNHYVTAEEVKMITDWLSGVKIIGDMGSTDNSIANNYAPDYIQTNIKDLIENADNSIFTLDFNLEKQDQIAQIMLELKDKVAFFVLKVENIDLLPSKNHLIKLCGDYNIFLSTNYTDDNISLVLNEIKPMGIVIYGSREEQPGLSSYDGIADILEQIELD